MSYKPASQEEINRVLAAFPNASTSTLRLNSGIVGQILAQNRPQLGQPQDQAEQGALGVRQDHQGPNKLEQALFDHLRVIYPKASIRFHSLTLRLANGVRYTPDVVVEESFSPAGTDQVFTRISCFEAKGGGIHREDAKVKIKVAPAAFPLFHFYLCTRAGRTGPWKIVKIIA